MKNRPISEIEAEIISEFEMFDDWMDKYQHIIDMGNELAPLDEIHKSEDNIVRGCQSKVWLVANNENESVHYEADSDAVITKGLIALLLRVFSDQSAEHILQADLAFLDQVGIREHLSPNRSNGLNAMIKQMKYYALALKAKQA